MIYCLSRHNQVWFTNEFHEKPFCCLNVVVGAASFFSHGLKEAVNKQNLLQSFQINYGILIYFTSLARSFAVSFSLSLRALHVL